MATSIEREAHESRKFGFARYVGFSIGNELVTSLALNSQQKIITTMEGRKRSKAEECNRKTWCILVLLGAAVYLDYLAAILHPVRSELPATHNSSTKPSDSGTTPYNSVQLGTTRYNLDKLTSMISLGLNLCLIAAIAAIAAAPFSGSARQPGWPSSAGSFFHQFPGLSRSLRSLQVPQTSRVPLHSPEQSGKHLWSICASTVHVLIQTCLQ